MAIELAQFFPSWRNEAQYEPLPAQGHGRSGARDAARRRQLLSLIILGGVILIAVGMAIPKLVGSWFRPPPWGPLEDFQNLNTIPLLNKPYYADPSKHAIVSSLYSDSYAIAVAVLAHSARQANTSARLILTYPEFTKRVSPAALCVARASGWELHPVPLIPAPNGGHGVYHRFLETFTKLQIWGFDAPDVGVEQVVYLDADTLVRRNFDELFALPWGLGAVPDVYANHKGFALSFNSGVLSLRTSSAALEEMRLVLDVLAAEGGREHGHRHGHDAVQLGEADQSFLNAYYGANVVRLPYVYNANLAIKERSPELWEAMVMHDEMRVVHYTLVKPFVDVAKVDAERGDESQLKVVLGEQLKRINENAKRERGGIFRNEMGWWWDAYESMMSERGSEIRQCLR
ncbi:hypothetical protein HWV62_12982 [Athelia sp. TMB]|nr:hypothetical protein HWV62_12982 [Athelia sp. TMB]